MIPLNILIALAALTEPLDIQLDKPPCPLPAFRAVAIALELMDERDAAWYFRDASAFAYDLKMVREHYEELRDAPPLCDANRFPRTETSQVILEANRAYRCHLQQLQRLYPADDWIESAISEAEEIRNVWDKVDDLHREYYSVYVRRRSLSQLRDLIGPYNYYGGFLPPAVPVWRFQRIE